MIFVSEAGSTRESASCEAITWPLVTSSRIHDLAAMVGGGRVCATAAERSSTLVLRATISFFIGWLGRMVRIAWVSGAVTGKLSIIALSGPTARHHWCAATSAARYFLYGPVC